MKDYYKKSKKDKRECNKNMKPRKINYKNKLTY